MCRGPGTARSRLEIIPFVPIQPGCALLARSQGFQQFQGSKAGFDRIFSIIRTTKSCERGHTTRRETIQCIFEYSWGSPLYSFPPDAGAIIAIRTIALATTKADSNQT
jgi:hypothetical protein